MSRSVTTTRRLEQVLATSGRYDTLPPFISPIILPHMATQEKTGFVNVDELQDQITVGDVLQFYGVDPGQVHRTQRELRMQCVLNCGKEEPTGDRALAIELDGVKRWKCHQYQDGQACSRSGNLVGLCDLLRPGGNCEGKPRGQRFKDIVKDLQAIAGAPCRRRSPQLRQNQNRLPCPPFRQRSMPHSRTVTTIAYATWCISTRAL